MKEELMNRSPDGQTLMLSSADGYCSIVVFDMSELGTVHATQQHNRQLAAIAQHHSHPSVASTPIPQSPAATKVSPAPSRTDREGSSVSSINFPPQSSSTPLFNPGTGSGRRSSTTSSIDQVLPTPGEENDGFAFPRISVSGSESGQSTSGREAMKAEGSKRVEEGKEEGPKKKRRVMLSKVADE
jgi:chromatin assembly factor 1 subunit B